MRMQTPLTAHKVRGAWIIEDATGARIATLPVGGPDDTDTEEDAKQLVTAANAHEAMVEALEPLGKLAEAVKNVPFARFGTVCEFKGAAITVPDLARAQAALALTQEAQ